MTTGRAMVGAAVSVAVFLAGAGCRRAVSPTSDKATDNLACALEYVAPAGRVVMARWSRQMPRSRQYVPMPKKLVGEALVWRAPACWVKLAEEVERRDVPEWTPVIFMHARRAPGSTEDRLVVLELTPRRTGDGVFYPGLEFWIVERVIGRDATGTPAVIHAGERPLPMGSLAESRVYAGQPDPKDTAHFTVHYEVEGGTNKNPTVTPQAIEGWLQKDGSLRLERRYDWNVATSTPSGRGSGWRSPNRE